MNEKYGSFIGIGVMKKFFLVPVVLLVMLCGESVLACSQEATGNITGGACSISELNNLEKAKNATEKASLDSKGVKDLRPVKLVPQVPKSNDDSCLFGMCIYKTLLGK